MDGIKSVERGDFIGRSSVVRKIRYGMPENVDLKYVTMDSREANIDAVERAIKSAGVEQFDIIVIDGLYRHEMIDIALQRVAKGGIIICDNAEGYGFAEGFRDSGLKRVDFFGNAPGVVFATCSCIYFDQHADIFSADYHIPAIYKNH
ncbi:MAG: putative O-methyltransferase YrrM [Arenicella sp.]|jgi:predicted O-methyltransferase YrrM